MAKAKKSAASKKKKPARKKSQRIPHVMFSDNDVAEQSKAMADVISRTQPEPGVTFDPPLDIDWHKDVAASFNASALQPADKAEAERDDYVAFEHVVADGPGWPSRVLFKHDLRAIKPKPLTWFGKLLKFLGIK
jgi:hypothetical protein